jgi:hypothetical protein
MRGDFVLPLKEYSLAPAGPLPGPSRWAGDVLSSVREGPCTLASLVSAEAGGLSVADSTGAVQSPGQRVHASADPGVPSGAGLPPLPEAVSYGGCAGPRFAGGRDPRMAGPRIQPPSGGPVGGRQIYRLRPRRKGAFRCGLSSSSPGRGAVHRCCRGLARVRRRSSGRRHERATNRSQSPPRHGIPRGLPGSDQEGCRGLARPS